MSNLPTVTSSIPRDLRNFVDRLRDLVNGSGSGRLISAKELADAGVVNIDSRGNLSTLATETVVFGPPPAPTNVAADAAIQNVIVTWDNPEYPAHAYAEVWGADTDDLGTAVLLGQAPGAIYTDPLGPGKTRYYWVRFVNTQYTVGPYNDISGAVATTGPDLEYTMDLLADAYGSTSDAPFFQLDAPQVINGVTIPAGTYMKAGFIYDGVITNAKIANAAIDNAKISDLSADKITAGTLQAGSYVRSSNYIAGSQGFNISANGTAEFRNAVVSGAIYASSGTFAGALSAATGTFAGSLSAATGTFSGELSAATGSFSGELTVGASPAISGTTMTGSGAHIYTNGRVVFGNAAKNITWDGTTLTINGDVVGTSNLNGVAIGEIIAGSFNFVSFTATGTTTWTVPAYVYKIKVTVIGGGGGGVSRRSDGTGGTGAGGGGSSIGVFSVAPGTVYTVTIGAGGAANNAGSASSFVGSGINVVCNGGAAGIYNSTLGAEALGGTASGGTINIRGGSGTLASYEPGNGGSAAFIGLYGGYSAAPANSGRGGAGSAYYAIGVGGGAGGSGLVLVEY